MLSLDDAIHIWEEGIQKTHVWCMTEARPVTGLLSVYLFGHQIEVTHASAINSPHTVNKPLGSAQGQGRRIQIHFLEGHYQTPGILGREALCPSCPVTRRCCNDTSCPLFLCTSQLEWFRRQSCLSPLVYTSNPLDKHHPKTLSSSSYQIHKPSCGLWLCIFHGFSGKPRAPMVHGQCGLTLQYTVKICCSCGY